MATYATVQDLTNYTEVAVAYSGNLSLETILQRAEKNIDTILQRPPELTNSIQGISVSGATGGTFALGLLWTGATFVTPPIPVTVDGPTLLGYLQAMVDQYGNSLRPSGSSAWQAPEVQYYSQPWAFGPLPGTPVVVEAYNQLGSQKLPVLTADVTNLTGSAPKVTVVEIVRGGLRANPYLLSPSDFQTLRDATCAQAEYRLEMGESFFRRAQWSSVSGPEFTTKGKLPLIGPKVMQELSGSDLVQRGARAVAGTARGRSMLRLPSGTTPLPDDWVM